MRLNKKIYLGALALALVASNCVKQKFDTPALAEFASGSTSNTGAYFVTSSADTKFKIPIGITTSANKDRVINFTVTSPSGATAGQQYTIASNSITIPAGKVQDSIEVKGIFAGYPVGRKDTLVFTITGGDVSAFTSYSTYTLVVQGYCDVVGNDLVGDYTNAGDFITGYGGSPQNPYTVTISDWTSTGATSATVKIHNLGATADYGFGDADPTGSSPGFLPNDPVALGLTAKLDWTNPSNFAVTIDKQPYVLDSYGNGPSTVKGSGTFSSCANTFTITFTVSDASKPNGYISVTAQIKR